jgi:hypothetical protein
LTTEIVWGLATDRSQVQASASAGRVDPQQLGRPKISRRAQASIPAAASAISRRTRAGARGCRSLFFFYVWIDRSRTLSAGRCQSRVHRRRAQDAVASATRLARFCFFFFFSPPIGSEELTGRTLAGIQINGSDLVSLATRSYTNRSIQRFVSCQYTAAIG